MSEQTKGKDTLMKLLLSTPVTSPMPSIQVSSPSSSVAGQLSGTPNSSSVPSPISDTCDDDCVKLTKYLHELAGQCGKEQSAVYTEHSYSRPSSWCPENTFVRPTRRLFMPECSTGGATKPAADEREAVLDVEGEVGGETPHDMSRVLTLMQECESAVSAARPDQNEDEDWEEKVPRSGWTPVQNRLFGKVARALHSDRLVRLAHGGAWNKPILRRVAVDKTVRRLRQTLASVGWDLRLAQWLHITLSEHLTNSYLAIYLDVLQKLRAKAPQLVDRMVGGRVGSLGPDTVAGLLKRPWDPAAASLGQHKPRKLPGNPILVVVPSTPAGINMHSSRSQHWLSHLSALGQVATVNMHSGSQTGRLAITNCLDQMVAAIKAKIGEIRVNCPGRPLILIGWNTAACIASQV
uniref:KAT8 regulatory NSL complex subunit 3 n=1 Tax=Timema poppense TaxID=170557 RepID=A0A7R9DN60_TIMPO|nr:unnamed protein product [Timema poppensis]